MIEQFFVPGSDFLDVGTGSGILMIAAAKLGAQKMTGIDTDELAIRISRENLDKNQVDPHRYELACTTLDQTLEKLHDMIVANIIAQVIVEIMGNIQQRLAKNGIAILSGIIQERKPDILSALKENHLTIIHEIIDEEWVALAVSQA